MHLHMAVSHAYPTIEIPSFDAISHPQIREAIQSLIDTDDQVRVGHSVNNRLKAGHNIDELTPQEIADAVAAAREGNTLRANAQAKFSATLNQHHGEWREQAAKRATQDRAAVLKHARALLDALNAFEVNAGISEMLEHGVRLQWKPSAECNEIWSAQQALTALVARIEH